MELLPRDGVEVIAFGTVHDFLPNACLPGGLDTLRQLLEALLIDLFDPAEVVEELVVLGVLLPLGLLPLLVVDLGPRRRG